ncbi:YhgE/Pip domain-containing protein [Methanosphaera cuniculi]|uniref:YhgE/Pip domain-containing protein n=1 Tax=Methanosphaera cuniculi TaxID=1077256 RepID=UPI0026EE32FD|nr:YhgE/Pip family protein [Methanosphaera cuniculi]
MIQNVKQIIKDDLNAAVKNPVVIFVLLALVILPSLYSIINVYGCWDPYENTDNMDFIIVNNDKPVTINGTTYDYGSEVVATLKENNNFNWVYKDEDEARSLVKNGTNYAAIVIPAGFTEDVLSINSADPHQATIQYISNDKTSPVAPKITSNAATKVNTEISNSIIKQYNMQSYAQNPVVTQQITADQMGANNNTNMTNASNTTSGATTQEAVMNNAGEYFHSPTVLSNSSYFKADNYAQQVTPFYSVLASWVGCIILVALLSTNPVKDEEKYTPSEIYVGKFTLFFFLNILQSIVTFIGLNLIGITIADPVMMIISMIIVGLSFMILIYSLVSVFGNVGKAIALIILVFQISGTNGIYPIEIMAPIMQTLMPYLPMTYGILMLKDTVFGIIWPSFIGNLACLIIFPILAIIFSVIVKEKLDKRFKKYDEKLTESKLFLLH